MKNSYDSTIQQLINELDDHYNSLDGNDHFLIEEYKNNCEKMQEEYGDSDAEYTYSEEKANSLVPFAKNYIDKQRTFLSNLLSLDSLFESSISKQIGQLIDDCLDELKDTVSRHNTIGSWYDADELDDYSEEYKGITQLSVFASVNKNIVLIGANGSGKTSYATIMKGYDSENITVIPAQKTLFYLKDKSFDSDEQSVVLDYMLRNSFESSKESEDYGFTEIVNNQFTSMILAAKKELMDYSFDCYRNNIDPDHSLCTFEKASEIFNTLFPNIQLSFYDDTESYNRNDICCIQDGEKHSINSLSEGEKAALYYSLCVLFAVENGYIIIDEPETYLNPSVSKILWDILIDQRPDCQFVFLTHSIDFVLSRYDSQIAWIKGFKYPDSFEIDLIDDNVELPRNMLIEILGSNKPILFCEGDGKGSIDHHVYRRIFGEKYTVLPVGGCSSVIQNCKVCRNLQWMNLSCKGIVDGDNYPPEREEKIKELGVFVLPFNEIEMFLIEDSIMLATVRGAYPEKADTRIKAFKDAFWECTKSNIEKMALEKTKKYVDDYLENEKVNSVETIDSLKSSFKDISALDLDSIYEKYISEIKEILDQGDYRELLKVCNLKNEIVPGLANKHLDADYIDKAIEHISEVKEELVKCYFQDLETKQQE